MHPSRETQLDVTCDSTTRGTFLVKGETAVGSKIYVRAQWRGEEMMGLV